MKITEQESREAFLEKFGTYPTEGDSWDYAWKESGWKAAIEFANSRNEEKVSESFEEWWNDHEINGICGGILNYEETMFGSRHISTEDIEHNTKEAWVACSLSHTKKMQEKDAEIERLKKKLEIQTKRVENLKKSNEFYAERVNWINTAQYKPWNNKSTIKGDTDDSTACPILMVVYSGKLARSCQAIDQELEKQLKEVK